MNFILHKINNYIRKVSIISIIFGSIIINSHTDAFDINVERNGGLGEMSYTREQTSDSGFLYRLIATAVGGKVGNYGQNIEINRTHVGKGEFNIENEERPTHNSHTETLTITGTAYTGATFDYANLFSGFGEGVLNFELSSQDGEVISSTTDSDSYEGGYPIYIESPKDNESLTTSNATFDRTWTGYLELSKFEFCYELSGPTYSNGVQYFETGCREWNSDEFSKNNLPNGEYSFKIRVQRTDNPVGLWKTNYTGAINFTINSDDPVELPPDNTEEGFEFIINGTGTSFTISNYCKLDPHFTGRKNIEFSSPKIYMKGKYGDYIEIGGLPDCYEGAYDNGVSKSQNYIYGKSRIRTGTMENQIRINNGSSRYIDDEFKYITPYYSSEFKSGINILCYSPSVTAIDFERDDTTNTASNIKTEDVTLECNLTFENNGEHILKITDGSYSPYNPSIGQINYIQIGTNESFRIYDYKPSVKDYITGNFNSGNAISINNITGLPNLETLDIADNKISDINFLKTKYEGTKLTSLNLSNNTINQINNNTFSRLSNLKNLDLSKNTIGTIDNTSFAGLSNLETLYLNGNNITTLPSNLFNGFNKLLTLDLKDNKITQLKGCTFCGLTKIKTLDLQNNKISSITTDSNASPFDNFATNSEVSSSDSIKIYLSGNLLTEIGDSLKKLVKTFNTYFDLGDRYGGRFGQGKNLDLYLRNNKIDFVYIEKNNNITDGINSFKRYGASQNQTTPQYTRYIKDNESRDNTYSGTGSLKSFTNYIQDIDLGSNYNGILHISLGSTYDELIIGEATPDNPTFTVTFDTNGGSSIPAQSVTSGDTATQPTNPTKENYTFDGRYSNSSLTNLYNFRTPVTQNITLYAKWTSNGGTVSKTYTVTFNTNGGSYIANQTVNNGSTVIRPTDPTKTNYKFAGWYSDSYFSNSYNFSSPVTQNITLHAKRTENSVTESSGGGTSGGGSSGGGSIASNLSLSVSNSKPDADEWVKLNIDVNSKYTGKITFDKIQYYNTSTNKRTTISVSSSYISDYCSELSKGYVKFSTSDYGTITISKFIKFSKAEKYRIYAEDDRGNDDYVEITVDSDSSSSSSTKSNESGISISTNSSQTKVNEPIDITIKTNNYYTGKVKLYAKYRDETDSWVKISNESPQHLSDYSNIWEMGFYKITSSDKGKKVLSDLVEFKKVGDYRIYAEDERGYFNYVQVSIYSGNSLKTTQTDTQTHGSAQTLKDTSNEIYQARSCKEYQLQYDENLGAFTSPNLVKQEYFVNKDYLKRYIDSKNPRKTGCPTNGGWISVQYKDTSSSSREFVAPNGKIYYITSENGYYSSSNFKSQKNFSSLQEIKYYIRDHNPLIGMSS